jgi:hypothetical protein
MTRDQSLHLASQLRALCEQAVGADAGAGVGGRTELSLRGMRDISMSLRGRGAANGAAVDSSGPGSSMVEISAHGPRVLDRALERASGGLIEVLNHGSGVELWCENRCRPRVPCGSPTPCYGFPFRFAILRCCTESKADAVAPASPFLLFSSPHSVRPLAKGLFNSAFRALAVLLR